MLNIFQMGRKLDAEKYFEIFAKFFFLNFSLPLLARTDLGLSAAFEQPLNRPGGYNLL